METIYLTPTKRVRFEYDMDAECPLEWYGGMGAVTISAPWNAVHAEKWKNETYLDFDDIFDYVEGEDDLIEACMKRIRRAGYVGEVVKGTGYSKGDWHTYIVYGSPDCPPLAETVEAWRSGDTYVAILEELTCEKCGTWEQKDAIGGIYGDDDLEDAAYDYFG